VEKPEKAEAMAERFREYVQTPVLTNVKVSFQGFEVYDAEPLTVPSMYAERPLLIYGKYKGKPSGKITIKGTTGEGNFSKTFDLNGATASSENSALKYLWARNRIMLLDDYGKVPGDFETTKKEVLNLGLKYNLLTAYTSFIAIDSEVRNNTGENTTVKQPLPLPEGVNNNAVGVPAGYAGNIRKQVNMKMLSSAPLEDKSTSEEVIEKEEPVFVTVEETATFQGGDLQSFVKWVQANIKYPKEFAETCITGKVFVQFTVDQKGKVVDIKILRGVDPLLDNEVIRVLNSSPKWTPAKQGGRAVRQTFTIPVVFKLE
jgi:Ca-activated chloride channel family protein